MSEELYSVILSLLAGLQTVFSPCLFPVLPAYLIFVARKVGNPLKVTLAFVAALSASLLVYALAVAIIGRTLLLALSLTPEIVSFTLATIFACLSVIELLPAKHVFSTFAQRSFEVKRTDVAGSAIMGALFAWAAAPCASAPLLAWTAVLLLQPSLILPSLVAFLAGVTIPFVIIGLLAQSLGQKLHRALARSFLVKYSHKLSAVLFAAFAFIVLLSAGDPAYMVEKYGGWFNELALALISLALLHAGASLLTLVPQITCGSLLLAIFPILAGATGVVTILFRVFGLQEVPIAPVLHLLGATSSIAAATVWSAASIREGGRANRWTALNALAQTMCWFSMGSPPSIPLLSEFALGHKVLWLSRYILCAASVGVALTLLAILAQARSLG